MCENRANIASAMVHEQCSPIAKLANTNSVKYVI